ncbi:DUF2589 domain-containing protein [Maridesulfovibrio sp. FT414]|uniref:DUF2589 domain-containing protein n=1 Tax=Maridesulfovibrio sp. FT414 TaxID=2979469 RepID=UPI003D80678C
MSNTLNFRDFIQAMASAVIETQNRIEKHQLMNIRSYFDVDSRPRCMEIYAPSMHPDAAENEEDIYRVPLLPLVAPNMLKVKDVEMTFDVELAGLLTDEDSDKKKASEMLCVNLAGGDKERANTLHVTLRVETSEPSDGVMRLMNHLTQTQGVYKRVDYNEE